MGDLVERLLIGQHYSDDYGEDMIRAANLITAQAAQIEGLRKALEPFAAYADPHGAFPADLPITSGSSMARKQLTMGDCYNAAEALSQFKGKE